MRRLMNKLDFIAESNRIEGIYRVVKQSEVDAHDTLWANSALAVVDLEDFVKAVAGKPLRRAAGQNVIVGAHLPPPGGSEIPEALAALLGEVNAYELTPYEAHLRYETLHPFMDGNGRSGRALWAWMMQREGQDPFGIGFLHRWYYQSLNGAR